MSSELPPLTPPGPPAAHGSAAAIQGESPDLMPPPLPPFTMSEQERAEQQRKLVIEIATSVGVVLVWFAAAALVGAWIWVQVTPLPEFTRIATTGTMDEEQLARQFSTSGWFTVIAAVGGLVSGASLLLLRRRSPVVMVGLVALGGALATWVMLTCGLAWGPGDPNAALATAKLGETVPVRLKPDAHAVYYVWSTAALFGAVLSLWVLESADTRRARVEASRSESPFYG